MSATAPVRSAMVTRSRAGRATDRDLRSLRRSARVLSCAATAKTKKPATSRMLKMKKPATVGILTKRKMPASSSSEGAGKGKILEPSELWKLKIAAYEAKGLWKEKDVPGALERWKAAEEEAKAAAAVAEAQPEPPKKRKRLVITRVPDTLIDVMKTHSYRIEPISAKKLAQIEKRSYGYTETYLKRKFIDDKMYAYEQALMNQYNIMGYAEDVEEVTDDEQEELA